MTYPTLPETGPKLRAAIDEIRARGLEVRTVSAGGTPTFFSNHDVPEVTEVRAGTYVYGDRSCIANGSVPLEDCALRVRATVVSRPTAERGILDAGSKTLTNDPAEEASGGGHGLIVEYPDARLYALSEEHGHVDLSACAERPRGGGGRHRDPEPRLRLHESPRRGGRAPRRPPRRLLARCCARQASLAPTTKERR